MRTKYSFLSEAPIQYAVGDFIRGAARSNAFKGAAAGAGIGAVGGMVNNAMKRDDDPSKKGIFGSALKGAGAGAIGGAVVGSVAGHLARSNMGRNLQNNMMLGGDKALETMWQKSRYQDLIKSGKSAADALAQVQSEISSGALRASNLYHFGTDNAGTLSRLFSPEYLTRTAMM